MEYRQLYLLGRDELKQAKIEEYELDARLLLEHVCHTDRNTLLAHPEYVVEKNEEEAYFKAISQRKQHIPLQHITGVQEFMGLEFQVNEHVLIPRQDTECLVEEVMRYLQDGNRILDMCTGSGCILLSLLHYSNYCTGVGVDVSEDALKVAKKNGELLSKLSRPNPWRENAVTFLQSDLFSKVPGEKFDIIVSNPPYIESSVISTLMEEVRNYEPMLALDGKEDGLFFYRRIANDCKDYLVREGMLFFEIGYNQAKAVVEILEEAGFEDVTVVKDLAGLDRIVYGSFA